MKWISIKDGLPPIGETVLTFGGWGYTVDRLIPHTMTEWDGTPVFKGDDQRYNLEVTHWSKITPPNTDSYIDKRSTQEREDDFEDDFEDDLLTCYGR